MKTTDELKKLDLEKLYKELNEAKQTLFKHRFDVENQQSKNSHLVKKYKTYIARLNTIIHEKNATAVSKPAEREEKPEKEAKK